VSGRERVKSGCVTWAIIHHSTDPFAIKLHTGNQLIYHIIALPAKQRPSALSYKCQWLQRTYY